MTRKVDRVGEAPPDEFVDAYTVNLSRPHRVAIGGVRNRYRGQGGCDQEVVVLEHILNRVVDLGAGDLVTGDLFPGQRLALLDPMLKLGRQVLAGCT